MARVSKVVENDVGKFGFTSKIFYYVKDEGTNLGTMTTTLKLVISCKALNLLAPFDGT
jgi:hypothetical protein